jgi:hypothetical protein
MKTYGVVDVQIHVLLSSSLDTGEWAATHTLAALPPRKGLPLPTGYKNGWVLELVWTLLLLPEIEPKFLGRPACSPSIC